MAAEGRFFLLEKIKHIIFVKNNQQSRKEEKDMKKITKKTLGEMIGEMLQVEELNANQMQIIDMLCKINESYEITSNTAYYDTKGNRIDEFEDFVVENDDEIWDVFNACKTLDESGEITKLVLLNTKKLDEVEIEEDSRIIVNFKYACGSPKFCYVRIMYNAKNKEGNIVKSVFNWNDDVDACTFNFNEVELHDKKSDFFIKIPLN